MANPIPFPEATRTLVKPPSMTDEECRPLPIHDTGEVLISCWRPAAAELEQLAAGAPIWLGVVGRGHPPVWIAVASPFSTTHEEAPPRDALEELTRYVDDAKRALGDQQITGQPLAEAVAMLRASLAAAEAERDAQVDRAMNLYARATKAERELEELRTRHAWADERRLRAEKDAGELRRALQGMLAAYEAIVEACLLAHDEGCPGDDTCACPLLTKCADAELVARAAVAGQEVPRG